MSSYGHRDYEATSIEKAISLIKEPACYSDNTSPVHPLIMQAMQEENIGRVHSYGRDDSSQAINELFSRFFETEVFVSMVATGTAANALALAAMCPPFGCIYVSEHGHTLNDECGAPEMFTGGAKIVPVADSSGKISLSDFELKLQQAGIGQAKRVQPSALSIAQVTELGTVYSLDEVQNLTKLAKKYDLNVHMDGARFANAIAHLECTPAEMTWKAGIDALSFGATKGGALAAEAVIFFRRELAEAAQYRTRRAGHTLSKMRYISAQWHAYLSANLWRKNACIANEKARALAQMLKVRCGGDISFPVDANEVFVRFSPKLIDRLLEMGHQIFRSRPDLLRFVTAWDTTDDDIERIVSAIYSVKEHSIE